jgi:hypothetical protein
MLATAQPVRVRFESVVPLDHPPLRSCGRHDEQALGGQCAGFWPGPPADQPKRGGTLAERRTRCVSPPGWRSSPAAARPDAPRLGTLDGRPMLAISRPDH